MTILKPGTSEFAAAQERFRPVEDAELQTNPLFDLDGLVAEHKDPADWIQAAGDALLCVAQRQDKVTADDIDGELKARGVAPPSETHSMGMVLRQGVNRHVIKIIPGQKVHTKRAGHHSGYLAVYRSLVKRA